MCPPLDYPLRLAFEGGFFGAPRFHGQPGGDCCSDHFASVTPDGAAGLHQIHEAVDLASGAGACVYAAYSGTIVGKKQGSLVIDHQGTGEAYATQYLHIAPGPKEIGDRVIKGEPIASVRPHPAGDHLHFELWHWITRNPQGRHRHRGGSRRSHPAALSLGTGAGPRLRRPRQRRRRSRCRARRRDRGSHPHRSVRRRRDRPAVIAADHGVGSRVRLADHRNRRRPPAARRARRDHRDRGGVRTSDDQPELDRPHRPHPTAVLPDVPGRGRRPHLRRPAAPGPGCRPDACRPAPFRRRRSPTRRAGDPSIGVLGNGWVARTSSRGGDGSSGRLSDWSEPLEVDSAGSEPGVPAQQTPGRAPSTVASYRRTTAMGSWSEMARITVALLRPAGCCPP